MPLPPDEPAGAGLEADVASIRRLLNLNPTGAVLVDRALRVLHVNGALATLTGINAQAAHRHPLPALLPTLPREVLDACQAALQGTRHSMTIGSTWPVLRASGRFVVAYLRFMMLGSKSPGWS